MSFFKVLRGILSAGMLAVPLGASAAPVTSFTGPFQSGLSGDPLVSLTGGIYQRETYPIVAARLQLIVDFENRPAAGDTWLVAFERKTADGVLTRGGTIRISYQAGDPAIDPANDCFLVNGGRVSDFFCSINARAEFGFRFTYGFRNLFSAQCIQVVDSQLRPFDYQIAGEFLPGGAPPLTSLGMLGFRPSEFPIRAPQVFLTTTAIRPRLPGDTTVQATFVIAEVFDDIRRPSGTNCGIRVPNVEVTVKNAIVPESGGHKHFSNPEEKGTGQHTLIFGQPLGDPADAQIKAKTDSFGGIVAQYTPGEFGLSETVRVTARDANRGIDLEAPTQTLNIRVPGLVPLDTANTFYTLRGSYRLTDVCDDQQHNDSETIRRSHYVTPPMRDLIGTMAGRFYSAEGVPVSLNDASLEFGGFFDFGSSDRSRRCHKSHRNGIDIDVNVFSGYLPCEGGVGLNCPATHPFYAKESFTRQRALILIAEELDGVKEPEEPLHFRFRAAQN